MMERRQEDASACIGLAAQAEGAARARAVRTAYECIVQPVTRYPRCKAAQPSACVSIHDQTSTAILFCEASQAARVSERQPRHSFVRERLRARTSFRLCLAQPCLAWPPRPRPPQPPRRPRRFSAAT